ncbi:hypothetical protein PENSPDRAFT_655840 [Peniophora sp. CONT]|nr:hypothetical protein PENSPDRAFT_655840 [Peniophora sp. CONT]
MFPISCNAFGDIVVVVQIVRDIVSALDDARGAAEEYKQLVHILTALGTVIEEVYCLAKDSPNEGLKKAVLAEIRRVCDDISIATDKIAGYDRLTVDSARSSRGQDHTRQSLSKLRWHFLKASEADKYVRRFDESFHRLNAYIGILGHQSVSQMLTEQREHALRTDAPFAALTPERAFGNGRTPRVPACGSVLSLPPPYRPSSPPERSICLT